LCCVAHFFDFKILIEIVLILDKAIIKKRSDDCNQPGKFFICAGLEQKKTHLTESGELIYFKPAMPIISN
jgi:hypothetical protein